MSDTKHPPNPIPCVLVLVLIPPILPPPRPERLGAIDVGDSAMSRDERRMRALVVVNKNALGRPVKTTAYGIAGKRVSSRPEFTKDKNRYKEAWVMYRYSNRRDDVSWLLEMNHEWKQPKDLATELIKAVGMLMVAAQEDLEHIDESYYREKAVRSFNKSQKPIPPATREAYDELEKRAYKDLAEGHGRLDALAEMEATQRVAEDDALAKISKCRVALEVAEEARAAKEADETNNIDIRDYFISRCLLAKKALFLVGEALRRRKQEAVR